MVIIKNVNFVDAKERLKASEDCNADDKQYLGMVSTFACGGALSIYGAHCVNYMPIWILNAICTYLKSTRKLNKPVIYQDYNFYIYLYGYECFVEVETKEVNKLPIE